MDAMSKRLLRRLLVKRVNELKAQGLSTDEIHAEFSQRIKSDQSIYIQGIASEWWFTQDQFETWVDVMIAELLPELFKMDKSKGPLETPGEILKDGTIIDEILMGDSPAFIVWGDPAKIPSGTTNWEIVYDWHDGERRLFPIKDDLLLKKKILLPSGIRDYESEEKLYGELVEFVNKWSENDPDLVSLVVLCVMSGWLREKVPIFPIICPRGGSDTGKTRLGDVLWQISFRGMRADGVLSLSSLFRNCDRWPGTLYVNEGDIDESGRSEDSESNQKVKFYLARIEANASVWRTNPNTYKPEVFNSFGSTILTTRKPFKDDALESRLFVIPTRGLTRTDIPYNLPPEFYAKGQELRDKLEMFRLRNLNRFVNDDYLKFEDLPSRMNQILQPIASLARSHLPGLFAKLQTLALDLSERVVEDRANSLDGQIVRAYFAIDPELKGVTAQAICDKMVEMFQPKDVPKNDSIGRRAKGLGFDRFKSNDRSRTRLLKLKPDYAKRMKSKYVPKEERDELDSLLKPTTQLEIDQAEKISKAKELFDQATPIEEIRQVVGPEIVEHCLEKGILPKVGGRE